MKPIRVAALISAGGTTLQNLIDRIADGRLAAEIVLVVSSNIDAYGLDRAERAGIATALVDRRGAGSREDFSRRIFEHCREAGADWFVRRVLQLITIPDDFAPGDEHSSGADSGVLRQGLLRTVHEAGWRGVKVTGCTVHFADNQYDHGPIIVQRRSWCSTMIHPTRCQRGCSSRNARRIRKRSGHLQKADCESKGSVFSCKKSRESRVSRARSGESRVESQQESSREPLFWLDSALLTSDGQRFAKSAASSFGLALYSRISQSMNFLPLRFTRSFFGTLWPSTSWYSRMSRSSETSC